jgi:ubiquinone/menaquinone biosynthesis C-methylase UbiE
VFNVWTAEIERIKAEYARRSRDIPSDFYSWARPENFFMHVGTARAAIQALAHAGRFPLDRLTIADIGCGSGTWLVEFMQWGADPGRLSGIDLDAARIETARRRLPEACLFEGEASRLPWPDESFDLVTQFTTFTSILDRDLKVAIAAEMLRVLKPGGLVLWYDFRLNNPRNPNVRGIGRAELLPLFPECQTRIARLTLAPPLARTLVPISWMVASAAEKLSFLRTHYLATIIKPFER